MNLLFWSNLVEDSGFEPLTQACKASVFPIILIPQIGCVRLESNQLSSAYETDEIPFLHTAIIFILKYTYVYYKNTL